MSNERNIEWSAKRSVSMGMLQVDFKSGFAKRVDNPKTFRLNKKEMSLLRIMDSDEWFSTPDFVQQYRDAEILNIAMSVATSGKGQSEQALKIFSHLDLNYKDDFVSMEKSLNRLRVSVSDLRKKIGSDLIQTKYGLSYHLKSEKN